MSLPVTLTDQWVSIILKQSLNGITGQDGQQSLFGVVDATPSAYSGIVSVGQSIFFEVNDKTRKVIYSNNTYYLIKESSIIFIETEITPP